MQAMVVILIALGGLGCQNSADPLPPIPPVAVQPAAPSVVSAPASETAPPSYSSYSGGYPPYYGEGFDSSDPSAKDSFRDCARDTFCSFFIGRSPDVPSACQIEAAYRAGYFNR